MAEILLNQISDYCSEPCRVDEPRFPVLHYTGKDDLDLPEAGSMTVKFRVKRETCETSKSGEKSYSYDIEISAIEKVTDSGVKQPYSRDKSAEESLDALMEAASGEEEGNE